MLATAVPDPPGARDELTRGRRTRPRRRRGAWSSAALLAMLLVVAMTGAALATAVLLEVDDVAVDLHRPGPRAGRHPGDQQGRRRRPADDPGARLRPPLRRQEAGSSRARTRCCSSASTPTATRRRDVDPARPQGRHPTATAATRSTPPTRSAASGRPCARSRSSSRTRRATTSRSTTSINVNFGAFRRAVNRLGCVYVDVDRDYFNDNRRRRRALRGDRRQAGLPEALRPGRAGLRALPPPGQRLRPRARASRTSCARPQPVGDREALPGRQAQAARSRLRPLLTVDRLPLDKEIFS